MLYVIWILPGKSNIEEARNIETVSAPTVNC